MCGETVCYDVSKHFLSTAYNVVGPLKHDLLHNDSGLILL